MGANCCKPDFEEDEYVGRVKTYKRPRWRSEGPITHQELQRMRDQFWDTEPHYGGDRGTAIFIAFRVLY